MWATTHLYFIDPMIPENKNIHFPLWQYLNQRLFCPHTTVIVNPLRFARFYNIDLLKRCWDKEFDPNGKFRN